jgi:hypothetical protein
MALYGAGIFAYLGWREESRGARIFLIFITLFFTIVCIIQLFHYWPETFMKV